MPLIQNDDWIIRRPAITLALCAAATLEARASILHAARKDPMKDASTLDRRCDPFSTLVDLTVAALTGRPFSPPSGGLPSESEAARIPPNPAWRPLLDRLEAFALKLARQVASDLRPGASVATRAKELRVLRSYY